MHAELALKVVMPKQLSAALAGADRLRQPCRADEVQLVL